MAKVMSSVRMEEGWSKNIRLKYGSISSWISKNYIKEFGGGKLPETILDLVKKGEVTKAQLKEIIKKC